MIIVECVNGESREIKPGECLSGEDFYKVTITRDWDRESDPLITRGGYHQEEALRSWLMNLLANRLAFKPTKKQRRIRRLIAEATTPTDWRGAADECARFRKTLPQVFKSRGYKKK